MPADSPTLAAYKPTARARATNQWPAGLPGVDGRSPWERRRRDVAKQLARELGHALTERDKALCSNVAAAIVRGEMLAAQMVRGESIDDEELTRNANLISRLLGALGLPEGDTQREPSLQEYLAQRGEKGGAA